MQEPAPTPYDIIAPPGIPYSPPLSVWILLCCLAAIFFVGMAVALQRIKRTERAPLDSPEDRVYTVLERCMRSPDSAENVDALVRALRRYISFAEGADVTSCAASELRALSDKRKNEQLTVLIESLVAIEQLRYRGVRSPEERLLIAVRRAFSAYVDRTGEG